MKGFLKISKKPGSLLHTTGTSVNLKDPEHL